MEGEIPIRSFCTPKKAPLYFHATSNGLRGKEALLYFHYHYLSRKSSFDLKLNCDNFSVASLLCSFLY